MPVICPLGFFCPPGAAAPTPCWGERQTSAAGSSAAGDCTECAAGFLSVPGGRGCVPLAVVAVCSWVAVAAALAAGARLVSRAQEDEVAAMVGRLRRALRMERRDGFFLSSERAWSWSPLRRGPRVVVQRMHMEAAARLALLREDFDPRHVDALCAGLYAHEQVPHPALAPAPATRERGRCTPRERCTPCEHAGFGAGEGPAGRERASRAREAQGRRTLSRASRRHAKRYEGPRRPLLAARGLEPWGPCRSARKAGRGARGRVAAEGP